MKWSVKDRRADFRVRNDSRRRRVRLDRLEALESRQLLTTTSYTFVAPDLSTLEHQANPTAAMFNRLVGSLQAQIVLGPLNDLQAIGGATGFPPVRPKRSTATSTSRPWPTWCRASRQPPRRRSRATRSSTTSCSFRAPHSTQTVALNAKRNDGIPGRVRHALARDHVALL